MNQIKLYNEVTVKSDDFEIRTHNEMYDFFSYTVGYEYYSGYLVLSSGGGVNGKIAVVKTVLGEYLCRGEADECYCEYTAVIDDETLAEGSVIRQVCLSPYSDGREIVNCADIGEIVKKKGRDITISVKLILDTTMTDCAFTSGENELIAVLLGRSVFYGANLELALGTNDHPPVPMERSNELISYKGGCGVSVSGGAITFSLSSELQNREVVLFINGKSVLRGYYGGGSTMATVVRVVGADKSVVADENSLSAVMQVKTTSDKSLVFTKRRLPKAVTADCSEIINFAVPNGARFVSEPSGVYFGIVDQKQVRVYKVFDREITHIYSVMLEDGYNELQLTSDGSLFGAGNGVIGWIYNGSSVQRNLFYSSPVTQFCAIYDGYHMLCYLNGNDFIRLYVDNGVSVNAEYLSVSSITKLARYDGKTMIMYDEYGTAQAYGVASENTTVTALVKSAISAGGIMIKEIHGAWYVCADTAVGAYHIGHIHDGNRNLTDYDTYATYKWLGRDEYAVISGGKIASIVCNNSAEYTVKSALPCSDIVAPLDMVAVGNYILLMYDGYIKTLYITSGGWRITAPQASVGENLILSGVKLNSPAWQSANIYKLQIKFRGE
ncbi:MAG: hypothetical protein IJY70_03235 [Clostridia bacterium]|nr:hypothetical protein [Clostridia bacterium]